MLQCRLIKRNKSSILFCLVILFLFVLVTILLSNYLLKFLLDSRAYNYAILGIPTDMKVYENKKANVFEYRHFSLKYTISNLDKCLGKTPFLLIFVKTHPDHSAQRQAIRETWGNPLLWPEVDVEYQPVVLFVLGMTPNKLSQNMLVGENSKYHDIVQQNFIENFHNLTLKLISHIKWPLHYCQQAKYWMTTDDDVFINVPSLISFLKGSRRDRLFVGHVHKGSYRKIDRTSKYYVPYSVYPGSYYPSYCAGGGYVLSMDVIKKIDHMINKIPLLYIDDIYLGLLTNAIGISPSNNVMFHGENTAPRDLCSFSKFITSHGFEPNEMHVLLKEVTDIRKSAPDPNVVCWGKFPTWTFIFDAV